MKTLYGIVIDDVPYKINFMLDYNLIKKLDCFYDLIVKKRLIDRRVDCRHNLTRSEIDVFDNIRFSTKDEILLAIEQNKGKNTPTSGFSSNDEIILTKLIHLQKLIKEDFNLVSSWIENKMQYNTTLRPDMLKKANNLYNRYMETRQE